MGKSVCILKNAEKKFGPDRVLGPVSLCVEAGSITGICGENGAGKSTLLSVMAGVLRQDAGEVTVNGKTVFAPQENAIYPSLSLKDNLAFWAGIYGVPLQQRRARIDAALHAVGLDDRKNRRAETCSGGMKRRLNLAAALLIPCDLLLLDEPTAGCDPASAGIVLDIARKVALNGAAVVIVSHNIDELRSVCGRIICLEHGMIKNEEQL